MHIQIINIEGEIKLKYQRTHYHIGILLQPKQGDPYTLHFLPKQEHHNFSIENAKLIPKV
jgi:hypothetical protein